MRTQFQGLEPTIDYIATNLGLFAQTWADVRCSVKEICALFWLRKSNQFHSEAGKFAVYLAGLQSPDQFDLVKKLVP
jgi:hypothetical protein